MPGPQSRPRKLRGWLPSSSSSSKHGSPSHCRGKSWCGVAGGSGLVSDDIHGIGAPYVRGSAVIGKRHCQSTTPYGVLGEWPTWQLERGANPEVLQLINSAAGGGLTYESDGLHRFLSSMDRRLCCEPVWMAFWDRSVVLKSPAQYWLAVVLG